MIKKKASLKTTPQRLVTAKVLQKVAAAMLPFYKAIACNRNFATHWSKAVIKADLERMQKLLRLVSPFLAKQSMASNGIGYFLSFSFPKPIFYYTSGTTIPPGSVQFFFETRVHQAIARSILPLYQELETNHAFALALAKAIRRKDTAVVTYMIRSLVKTPALKSSVIEDWGVTLLFKYSFSKYKYRHLLFLELY